MQGLEYSSALFIIGWLRGFSPHVIGIIEH